VEISKSEVSKGAPDFSAWNMLSLVAGVSSLLIVSDGIVTTGKSIAIKVVK
jgi:hypothetical protein